MSQEIALIMAFSAAVGISTLIAASWTVYVTVHEYFDAERKRLEWNFARSFIRALLDNVLRFLVILITTSIPVYRLSNGDPFNSASAYVYGAIFFVQLLLFISVFYEIYERLTSD